MSRTGPMHYSELNTMRQCPKKHHYAYVEGLQSKAQALNLKRGLWLHSMLEADALKRGFAHGTLLEVPSEINVPGIDEPVTVLGVDRLLVLHSGTDTVEVELSWKGMLELLEHHTDYALFPDHVIEERYTEGGQDLPTACRNIMRGYLWQYRDVLPKRRPLLVEVEWAKTLTGNHPDVEMEGRADLVEIDERGLVCLVDWKSTKSLPGQEFKLMESQRYLYLWGLTERLAAYNYTVHALAFDYLITSTPTVPKQNKPKKAPKAKSKCSECDGTGEVLPVPEDEEDGENCPACEGQGRRINLPTPNELKGELSVAQVKTTPLVYFETLKELELEITEHHRERLNELGANNDFYQRFNMPVNMKALKTVLSETGSAAGMAEHFRANPDAVYRNVDRSCTYMCDFLPLCMAELYGQDASTIRTRDYEPRHRQAPDGAK